MTATGRRGVRRLLAAAGVLMVLAAAVVLVVSPGGDGDRTPSGEAGSRFGGARDARSPAPLTGERARAYERSVAGLVAAGFPAGGMPSRDWGVVLVTGDTYRSPSQMRALVRAIERRARRSGAPRPLVLADPEELGRLGPFDQPVLGASEPPRAARLTARAAARRVRAVGVDLVLAPSADVAVEGTASEVRAFGDDPAQVAEYTREAVAGWLEERVVPVPGRFPGEGAASQDPIEGPATVGLSLEELAARDLRPFTEVVGRAPAVQMSAALYAAWDGVTPATVLPEAVGLLRRRLRFGGAIVSADLVAATAATGESVGRAAVDALRAGCDVLLVPGGRAEQEEAVRAVVRAVAREELPRARVEQALRRVASLRRVAGQT